MPDFRPSDSAFVPTTEIYNIQELNISTPGLKEFLVSLTETVNNISLILNMKDTGSYFLEEFINGQSYFPVDTTTGVFDNNQEGRAVYRTVVFWNKPLPTGAPATLTQAHNIEGILPPAGNTTFRFTRIYGCATDPAQPEFIPLPYASTALNSNISLQVDETDVIITSTIDRSNFTQAFIVLEYVKES